MVRTGAKDARHQGPQEDTQVEAKKETTNWETEKEMGGPDQGDYSKGGEGFQRSYIHDPEQNWMATTDTEAVNWQANWPTGVPVRRWEALREDCDKE